MVVSWLVELRYRLSAAMWGTGAYCLSQAALEHSSHVQTWSQTSQTTSGITQTQTPKIARLARLPRASLANAGRAVHLRSRQDMDFVQTFISGGKVVTIRLAKTC